MSGIVWGLKYGTGVPLDESCVPLELSNLSRDELKCVCELCTTENSQVLTNLRFKNDCYCAFYRWCFSYRWIVEYEPPLQNKQGPGKRWLSFIYFSRFKPCSISTAIKYDPTNVRYLWERCSLQMRLGEHKQCMDGYRRILSLLPLEDGEHFIQLSKDMAK